MNDIHVHMCKTSQHCTYIIVKHEHINDLTFIMSMSQNTRCSKFLLVVEPSDDHPDEAIIENSPTLSTSLKKTITEKLRSRTLENKYLLKIKSYCLMCR